MPFNSEHVKYAKAQTKAVSEQGQAAASSCLVPLSREIVTVNSKMDQIEKASKNTIYVRDLSSKTTENAIRAVFSEFDRIMKVGFHRFNNPDGLPNLNAPPFAEIQFATDKGVTEASKMTGLLVAGTPCTVTIINPNVDIAAKSDETKPERLQTMVTYTNAKELKRSEVDLQIAKTIHICGLSSWMTETTVQEVLEQCFGGVIGCRVDTAPDGKKFALAEFKIMQSAMLALRQKQVAMEMGEGDDQERVVWDLTPSKALVHEQQVVEKAVSFSHTTIMVNAYGGLDYAAVQQALELNDKLAQVQQTAWELGIQSNTHADGKPKTEREKLAERIAMLEHRVQKKKQEEEEEKERKKEKKREKQKKKLEKHIRKDREKKKKRSRSSSHSSSRSSSSSGDGKKKDKKKRKRENCEMLQ